MRTALSLFFPQRAHPGLDSGARHPWLACHRPSAVRVDHVHVLLDLHKSLFRVWLGSKIIK